MSDHPSYCCQQCGECIGWVGRGLQAVLGPYAPHDCGRQRRMMAEKINGLPGPNPVTEAGASFYEGRRSAILLLDPNFKFRPTPTNPNRSEG